MSYKILFVCHGNICRSPMAEFIMKNMAEKAGVADELEIASAATSAEEIGNPVYPEARRKLAQHGIDCAGKTARRLARADSVEYDLLIGMDAANIRDMKRICGAEAVIKSISCSTTRTPRHIRLRPMVHARLRQSVERYRGRVQRTD